MICYLVYPQFLNSTLSLSDYFPKAGLNKTDLTKFLRANLEILK